MEGSTVWRALRKARERFRVIEAGVISTTAYHPTIRRPPEGKGTINLWLNNNNWSGRHEKERPSDSAYLIVTPAPTMFEHRWTCRWPVVLFREVWPRGIKGGPPSPRLFSTQLLNQPTQPTPMDSFTTFTTQPTLDIPVNTEGGNNGSAGGGPTGTYCTIA